MKNLKRFQTKDELDNAIKAIESKGIKCERVVDDNFSPEGSYVLQVHVSNFIKARDILIEMDSD